MPELLLEIGTEEIPAGYIGPALEALSRDLETALGEIRLSAEAIRTAGTPRRLVVHAAGVPEEQASLDEEVSGPPKRVAFGEDGQPTKAAEGFARKQGVEVTDIQVRETDKGPYCYVVRRVEGQRTAELLQEVLPQLIPQLPFPKSMHWEDPTRTFARPVRSIVALLGEEVIDFEYAGVKSGRTSNGHPFLSPEEVTIRSADFAAYRQSLLEAKVIVDIDERREAIEEQLGSIYAAYGSEHNQPKLVEEVAQLVEWPHALEGQFEEEFLEVPPEVIETAMMGHQRYFPVRDAEGRLLNRFAFISNRDGTHGDVVRTGNERVLRARLADARFFWDEDRKSPLGERVEPLKNVLYQIKLGSYHDRALRLQKMADFVADQTGAASDLKEKLTRSALLCKTDLLTQMVYEFPSLQGVMGRHYALESGEAPEVATAIEEHYLPRQASGALPDTELGALLALSEKADTVAACFAADLSPTANQDPYGLRRQTLGLIRIILERRLSLPLSKLFRFGLSYLPDELRADEGLLGEILRFVRDRLYQFCLDSGYRYDLVNAALDPGFDDLLDLRARLDALTQLSADPEWEELVEVVGRTYNIFRKSPPTGELVEELLAEDAEKSVFEVYRDHGAEVRALFDGGEYVSGAKRYHEVFSKSVHQFFDEVYVNVDDQDLRNNRLLLMSAIYSLFAEPFADLVEVVVSGDS